VVEITFSGERGYQKDLPVATATKLVASGTYSQTSKATIDYDYSTESKLATSGVVTTTGKGTASLAGSSHTWWNGGTGQGKLTAPDGTSVSHTESGDRNETTKVATDWVFAGGGWQEQQTVLDTSGGSKGSFSSSMDWSWNVAGDPDGDGPGTYSKGSFVTSATGSHDYTSSSKLTRTAVEQGGFAVTGWRTGGGESHGTSSVDLHGYDTREYLKQVDVVANDAYDYTNDTWKITFDATGMPRIQYSGSLQTSEHYSSVHKGVINALDGVINLENTRTRSAVTDEPPWFLISPGRGGLVDGYGNSFSVDGAGYGYNESKAMPGAFGGGQAPEATPPEPPSGASVVPKGIASEASNYEVRLAELSKPRTVTSGSRPLGAGSANLPTMPKVTTPAIGALGFTKSDSAPEKPTTRAFASLVTSGMSAPVGAMAETGQAGGLFGGLLSFGAPGDWLDRNFGGGAYGPPDAFGRAAAGIRTIAAFAPIAGEISDFSEVFSGVGPNGETLSGWERGATFVAAGIPFVPAKIAREAVGAAGKAADDVVSAAKGVIGKTDASPVRGIGGKGWRGDKLWRDQVTMVRRGGDVKLDVTATRQEAIDLLEKAGCKIDRIEGAHLPPNPHQFPHINFTTPDGLKGVIPIVGLEL
jgi:hypothetical protein